MATKMERVLISMNDRAFEQMAVNQEKHNIWNVSYYIAHLINKDFMGKFDVESKVVVEEPKKMGRPKKKEDDDMFGFYMDKREGKVSDDYAFNDMFMPKELKVHLDKADIGIYFSHTKLIELLESVPAMAKYLDKSDFDRLKERHNYICKQ